MSDRPSPRRLRVLHVRSTAALAGPERQILELARALPALGVDPELAVLAPAAAEAFAALAGDAAAAGLPLHVLATRRFEIGAAAAALARLVGERGIDLVHAHDYKANAVTRWAARRLALPAVATVHLHTRASVRLRAYAWLDRALLPRFSAVVLVARALAADPAVRGIARERLRVVPNGLDPEPLRARAERERPAAGAHGEPPAQRLLAAGRLVEQKGFDLLLRALARIAPRHRDLRLAVAGDGPERGALAALGRRLGLDDRVRFLGARPDVAGLMAASDLVVLPSRHEGLPYVALEAMALERPVVAAAAGGLPDLVRAEREGWLVPAGDVQALAAALDQALAGPAEARRRARLGRRRVEEAFHARGMATATAEVYRGLVA
jgi:glycosyltransferase involved in cell wall biosynthesis